MSINQKLSKKEALSQLILVILIVLPLTLTSVGGMSYFYLIEAYTKLNHWFLWFCYSFLLTLGFIIAKYLLLHKNKK